MLRRLLLLALTAAARAQSPDTSDWGYTGGDIYGQRYSSLADIDRDNVAKLDVAWQFRTGERAADLPGAEWVSFSATPVLAFGLLYLSTPSDVVIALDPATGRQRWRHDPRIDRKTRYETATSRGVTVWEGNAGACARRVFIATLDGRLIALDAGMGTPCAGFGNRGTVDLRSGIRDTAIPNIISPPAVYGSTVVIGAVAPNGSLRAFDAQTGAARWILDTNGPAAAMSVDPDNGLLFAPAGSTLLAVNALSGQLAWRQELLHHDLWGYNLAAQPLLVDLELQGMPVSTVLQATATGMLFVFDRVSGKPVFPVVEQRVPASHLRGVRAAVTQPFPVTPSLVNQTPLDPKDAWGMTFWDRGRCRKLIAQHRNEGIYTPPDPRGSILSPGLLGGVTWGGVAFDTRRQRVFAAVNHLPMIVSPDGARREYLLSPLGFPCTAPPWGSLVSVDLPTNRIVWQVPLGTNRDFGPWFAPTRAFGTPNAGGPIVTAGELVFVGAAADSALRAFDLETGRELWKHRLPAGGQATPMTYRAGPDHRQFVAIAAGGDGELGTPAGNYIIAFSLRNGK